MTSPRPARVVAISAGMGQPSSSRLLADRVVAAVRRDAAGAGLDVEVEVIELRPLARDLADHLLTGVPSARLREALSAVAAADGVIAVTPVFAASYAGLFKTFVDLLDPDALTGTPVVVAATAGTARHSLVLDHALRPLFTYLRAVVVPTGVFAATDDFGSAGDGAGADGLPLQARVERAAAELVDRLCGPVRPGRDRVARVTDEAGRVDTLDAEVTPFAQLLGRSAGERADA